LPLALLSWMRPHGGKTLAEGRAIIDKAPAGR